MRYWIERNPNMGKNFSVEFRKDCKICGKPLKKGQRVYCSKLCRNREYNKRYAIYRREWQRDWWGKAPEIEGTKIQCPLCKKWYVQVGSHIVQRHGYETAREFREDMGLDVKRGIVPEWCRQLKGELALDNDTWKNLKKGQKFWFKKGSKVAGRYKRSKQTVARLQKQGASIGKQYGGKTPAKRLFKLLQLKY